MAKPRIFVSSTYIDLKHARRHIESFIKQMGYETVLFENGDITFHHEMIIDESCYAEIESCHMLILIIGGKYGSPSSEHSEEYEKIRSKEVLFYNSITKKEYLSARQRNIPIFIFVEKGVHSEYQTFKKNRENLNVNYAHVDDINIFRLLDEIVLEKTNNYIKTFENFEDITIWLKDQWAGMFADYLSKKNTGFSLLSLHQQISELSEVSQSLKTYNEQLLKSISPESSDNIIREEDLKLKQRKAARFARSGLIRYIKRKSALDLLGDELFDYFSSTKDFEDFLNKCLINDEGRRFLLADSQPLKDYLRLRNDFLDENNDIGFNET